MMQTNHARIALVTGASRGLGRSMALALADAGVDVLGTYRSARAEADAVAREVRSRGRRAAMLPLDVLRSDTFAAFAESVAHALHDSFEATQFDALVNNAGSGMSAPVAGTTESQFDEMVSIHRKAPFFITQRLLPYLRDGGQILNVSTGLTRFTLPGYAAYASAKGGVEVLTRYLAKELGERNITANVIAPGAIATDFGGGLVRDNAEVQQYVASTIPLGRVGLPDDIGPAVAALLSEKLRWMNGVRVEVSGGQSL
jgi:NAD(P)-dependent dehydrogenase (short-subunit alcohol dehydrogenase family)